MGAPAFHALLSTRWAILISVLLICTGPGLTWAVELDELQPEQKQILIESLEHIAAARASFEKQQIAEATQHMQAAIRLALPVLGKDHGSLAGKYADLATMMEMQGKFDAAIALRIESLRIVEQTATTPDDPLIPLSYNALGMSLLNGGRPRLAAPILQEALKRIKAIEGGESIAYTTVLNNLGKCQHDLGDYESAEQTFRDALEIRRQGAGLSPAGIATSANNLGELLRQRGSYAEARVLLDEALKIQRAGDQPRGLHAALTLNNLGMLANQLGDFPTALENYEAALEILRELFPKNHPEIGRLLANRGANRLRQQQYAEALEDLSESRQILEEAFHPAHPDLANIYGLISEAFSRMGKHADAARMLTVALAINRQSLGDQHPEVAFTLGELGIAAMHDGRPRDAERYFSESLPILRETLGSDHFAVAKAEGTIANWLASQDRREEARLGYDRSQRIVRRHSLKVLPGLPPNEQALHRGKLWEQLNYGLSFGWKGVDDRRAVESSAEWVLNNKAILNESIGRQTQLQFIEKDNPTARQLLETRRKLGQLAMRVPDSRHLESHTDQVKQLQSQEADLSRGLASGLGFPISELPWHRLAELREALPADAVLVEFARIKPTWFDNQTNELEKGDERYLAWVVPPQGRGETHMVDLGSAAAIDAKIETVRKQIRDDGPQITSLKKGEHAATLELQPKLDDLAAAVLKPLGPHLREAQQLIFSPDSNLWLLPWAALSIDPGQTPLIETKIPRLVTSGRELLQPVESAVAEPGPPAVFANPDYNLSPPQIRQAVRGLTTAAPPTLARVPKGDRRIPPLPQDGGLEVMAQRITADLATYAEADPQIYLGHEALETRARLLISPKVLIFGTHGFFLPDREIESEEELTSFRLSAGGGSAHPMENPFLRCGLLLAGYNASEGDDGLDDGILTGIEVLGMDLRGTQMVILAACETGIGEVKTGEAVASLRQAFQLAGARSVVSTLWRVNSRATTQIVERVFKQLGQGQDPAQALAEAQRAMIESSRQFGERAHPYFWAGFTFTGNVSNGDTWK